MGNQIKIMKAINIVTYTILLIFTLSLIGCNGAKVAKQLKTGYTSPKIFKTSFPFEVKQGLIIVKTEIKNKIYDFILDTGASNVISKELANELNISPIDSEDIYDTQGNKQNLEYQFLNNVKLGDINFSQTFAAIINYNEIEELSCLNVSGIIGANLMRHAVWDINFENQTITITNSEDALHIPKNYHEVKFFIGYQGTPAIIIKLGKDRILNNSIDFGSNAGITFSESQFEKLLKNSKIQTSFSGYGYGGVGIYGHGKKRKFSHAIVNDVKLGDLILDNTSISFNGTKKHNQIGLSFLKNYRVILNWSSKKMKLVAIKKEQKAEYFTYGFSPVFRNNKLYIGSIIEKSSAHINGLQPEDQILSIDKNDYSSITNAEWCQIWEEGLIQGYDKKIEIKTIKDGKIHSAKLSAMDMLGL